MEVKLYQQNKSQFLPNNGRVDTAIWMHHMDANKTYGEKAWQQLKKNVANCIEEVLEATPHKTAALRPPTTHHKKLSKLDELDMRDTAGEVRKNS